MKDIPIIFSGPMVRALLDGRKTMTRRLLRDAVPETPAMDAIHPSNTASHAAPYLDAYCSERKTKANPRGMGRNWCWWTRDDRACPQFKVGFIPGDRLWVRENWKPHSLYADMKPRDVPRSTVFYQADQAYAPSNTPWVPCIHMPRWVSRLTLLVTAVKVERLQDIGPDDAWNEGVERRSRSVRQMWLFGADAEQREQIYKRACVWEFEQLWNKLHGDDAWDRNPEVVALTFTVHKTNIDAMPNAQAA